MDHNSSLQASQVVAISCNADCMTFKGWEAAGTAECQRLSLNLPLCLSLALFHWLLLLVVASRGLVDIKWEGCQKFLLSVHLLQ